MRVLTSPDTFAPNAEDTGMGAGGTELAGRIDMLRDLCLLSWTSSCTRSYWRGALKWSNCHNSRHLRRSNNKTHATTDSCFVMSLRFDDEDDRFENSCASGGFSLRSMLSAPTNDDVEIRGNNTFEPHIPPPPDVGIEHTPQQSGQFGFQSLGRKHKGAFQRLAAHESTTRLEQPPTTNSASHARVVGRATPREELVNFHDECNLKLRDLSCRLDRTSKRAVEAEAQVRERHAFMQDIQRKLNTTMSAYDAEKQKTTRLRQERSDARRKAEEIQSVLNEEKTAHMQSEQRLVDAREDVDKITVAAKTEQQQRFDAEHKHASVVKKQQDLLLSTQENLAAAEQRHKQALVESEHKARVHQLQTEKNSEITSQLCALQAANVHEKAIAAECTRERHEAVALMRQLELKVEAADSKATQQERRSRQLELKVEAADSKATQHQLEARVDQTSRHDKANQLPYTLASRGAAMTGHAHATLAAVRVQNGGQWSAHSAYKLPADQTGASTIDAEDDSTNDVGPLMADAIISDLKTRMQSKMLRRAQHV